MEKVGEIVVFTILFKEVCTMTFCDGIIIGILAREERTFVEGHQATQFAKVWRFVNFVGVVG